MKRNKIISILEYSAKNKMLAGILAVSLIGAGGILLSNNVNFSNNTIGINKTVLAGPLNNDGNKACVINGDDNLVLYTSANGSNIESYISVGEMLTINSYNSGSGYYNVTVKETGVTGYITKANIEKIVSGTSDSLTSLNGTAYITNVSTGVNLREEATMNSTTLATLQNNTSVTLLGKEGEWYEVEVNGTTGYIYEEYIAIANTTATSSGNSLTTTTSSSTTASNVAGVTSSNATSSTTASSTPNSATTTTGTTSSSTSSIGSTDATTSSSTSSTGAVTSNTGSSSATKATSSNSNTNATTGTTNSTSGTSQYTAIGKTGYISPKYDCGIYIYSEPNLNSTHIARLYTGDTMEVVKGNGQWAEVVLNGAEAGYVQEFEITYTKPKSDLYEPSGTVTNGNTNQGTTESHETINQNGELIVSCSLFAQPDVNFSNKVVNESMGTIVKVVYKEGTWYAVQCSGSSELYYVHTDNVHLLGD